MIDEVLADELDFEDIKFPVKIKDIHKIEKKYISNSVFGYESKKNIQLIFQKNVMKTNLLIYYKQKKKTKRTMFLLKILILS